MRFCIKGLKMSPATLKMRLCLYFEIAGKLTGRQKMQVTFESSHDAMEIFTTT